VVAESPFGDFREAAFDRIADKLRISPTFARLVFTPTVAAGFAYARWKYGVDMRQASPAAAVRDSIVPVLLIHGLADVNLRPRESRLIQAANPDHVTVWYVPGAAHCGASAVAPGEFRTRVLGFYAHALPPHSRS
jgi:pimeloyl-ACP methyl ester carboxylesterase